MARLVLVIAPENIPRPDVPTLGKNPLVFGRDKDRCDVFLASNAVSREHVRLVPESGRWAVYDLKSRNKTFVNGRAIYPDSATPLSDGDEIKICDFTFRYEDVAFPRSVASTALPSLLNPSAGSDLSPEPISSVEATLARSTYKSFLETQPSEQLKLILEVSATLARTREIEPLLPQIADELFKVFRQADRCFIIQSQAKGVLIPTVTKTRRPGVIADRFSKTIVQRCLDTLESYLSDDASGDAGLGTAASIAEFRIRSVMCVPLVTQDGQALGVIQLDSQDRTKKFTANDLKLLVCVATQAAIALHNATLLQEMVLRVKTDEENRAASRVQQAILPRSTPKIAGYDFFSYYQPARTVGGDYFDFLPMPEGRQAILLGDVSGKGVPAALVVARMSGESRLCVLTRSNLAEAVALLNDKFFESNLDDRFMTLVANVLDPQTHQVTMVNAGHFDPLVYRHATETLELAVPRTALGFAVGQLPDVMYETHLLELNAGDCVILYTDGVLDAEGPDEEPFGRARLESAIESADKTLPCPAQTIGKSLCDAIRRYSENRPQFDDIAIVCFGRPAEESLRSSSLPTKF